MIGVRKILNRGDRKAVVKMRRMHSAVISAGTDFATGSEICFWNDSVLIHTLVDESRQSHVLALRQICQMKAAIDSILPSYCICAKGRSFPSPSGLSIRKANARLVYLSASSLAFTNCFIVEAAVQRSRLYHDWYIDNRIVQKAREIISRTADGTKMFRLYPRGSRRIFHMFRGSFLVKRR